MRGSWNNHPLANGVGIHLSGVSSNIFSVGQRSAKLLLLYLSQKHTGLSFISRKQLKGKCVSYLDDVIILMYRTHILREAFDSLVDGNLEILNSLNAVLNFTDTTSYGRR